MGRGATRSRMTTHARGGNLAFLPPGPRLRPDARPSVPLHGAHTVLRSPKHARTGRASFRGSGRSVVATPTRSLSLPLVCQKDESRYVLAG